ncbi:TolB-like translocation protein [Kordiimonas aestuarii]|uniref:hypothetical protein n=1 Tax=Kordiimonas aestuarii TaxID=1005925 RepID=UPI0021CFB9F5|nr:hypothetical protein [Kordiimonas aestuarii]
MQYSGATLVLLVASATPGAYAKGESLLPAGPYLGQTPPGMTAQVFAPGAVSTPDGGDAGRFSPDMNTFYVQRWRSNDGKTERSALKFERTDTGWREVATPEVTRMPFFAPDGKTLHYGNRHKVRTRDGWSEMKNLGAPYDDIRIMSLSVSLRGTYVFDEVGTNGNGILRYSEVVDGKREAPRPFGPEINTGIWNAHPFIAPDESYIMWDGERESGFGSSDLYISFRQPDGSWGEAINLGDRVNTDAEEGGPQITPDGKYLFFNRMVAPASGNGEAQSDLFWIDAGFIDGLKPEN